MGSLEVEADHRPTQTPQDLGDHIRVIEESRGLHDRLGPLRRSPDLKMREPTNTPPAPSSGGCRLSGCPQEASTTAGDSAIRHLSAQIVVYIHPLSIFVTIATVLAYIKHCDRALIAR